MLPNYDAWTNLKIVKCVCVCSCTKSHADCWLSELFKLNCKITECWPLTEFDWNCPTYLRVKDGSSLNALNVDSTCPCG